MQDYRTLRAVKAVRPDTLRLLQPGDAVVKAPSPHRERYAAMHRTGVVTSMVGAFGGLAGVVGTAVTYESWLPESGTPITGWEVFFAVAFLAGFLLVLGGTSLAIAADRRHVKAGVLTAGELMTSPAPIKAPMLEAIRAADTIRSSNAYQEGWLTDVDLDAALWELAQHLKVGEELTAELANLAPGVGAVQQRPADPNSSIEQTRSVLADCTEHVRTGAERLVALAQQVEAFDDELAAPARRAAIERFRAAQEAAKAERAERLDKSRDKASAKLAAIEPALDNVADRIAGQIAAYDELPIDAQQVSGDGGSTGQRSE
jgi:hypothetical protein